MNRWERDMATLVAALVGRVKRIFQAKYEWNVTDKEKKLIISSIESSQSIDAVATYYNNNTHILIQTHRP